jgi:hypothetical protein
MNAAIIGIDQFAIPPNDLSEFGSVGLLFKSF